MKIYLFLFQIPLFQNDAFTFFVDKEFQHHGNHSNEIKTLYQNEALGNHNSDNNDSIDMHGDECPSTFHDLLFSQENMDF